MVDDLLVMDYFFQLPFYFFSLKLIADLIWIDFVVKQMEAIDLWNRTIEREK